jgi:hypothetical protein
MRDHLPRNRAPVVAWARQPQQEVEPVFYLTDAHIPQNINAMGRALVQWARERLPRSITFTRSQAVMHTKRSCSR